MYYLFIGFLAPAILFLILGLFACLKKSSSRHDDKDYQSIYSSEEAPQVHIRAQSNNKNESYQMIYENPHFVEYKRPPSYTEAVKVQACSTQPHRHLPPNQPKILHKPYENVHKLSEIIY